MENGNHDDKKCEEYCKRYKRYFGQELPDCQFKGNKSKIQNLIRKVHIYADGRETEVQFVTETSNEEDFQIPATENQEMNVSKVEQDDITENTEDFLKMIHALRSDLQSKENIDEKWLESLQSMESHYIQENQAREDKSTKEISLSHKTKSKLI